MDVGFNITATYALPRFLQLVVSTKWCYKVFLTPYDTSHLAHFECVAHVEESVEIVGVKPLVNIAMEGHNAGEDDMTRAEM